MRGPGSASSAGVRRREKATRRTQLRTHPALNRKQRNLLKELLSIYIITTTSSSTLMGVLQVYYLRKKVKYNNIVDI